MLVRLVPFVATLTLCLCDFPQYSVLNETTTNENDLIQALDKILNFFHYDKKNVNVDGLTGTIFAEVYNKLLHTNLWEINTTYSNHSLKYFTPYDWSSKPDKSLLWLMYRGPPNEMQSNVCIEEIIDTVKGISAEEHDCVPSFGCHSIMSQLHISHGYPLTHKLLYIQLSRGLQCRLDKHIVELSIKKLCSRILQEHRSIEKLLHKNIVFQDLYTEQMLLCGVEGFTEFLTHKARANLLAFQSAYGCYGQNVLTYGHRWRQKREGSFMKYGCESHFTGLAAAAIAVNLNFIVSTASSISVT